MKLRKKPLIIGAIALCVAAGVLSMGLLIGCGPHRLCKRDFTELILKRMDKHVAKLDLSDVQRTKYEELRAKVKANLTEGFERRRQLHVQLQSELNKEHPDMNILAGLVKDQLKGIHGSLDESLGYFAEFYNTLTDDQKAQVIQKLRKKLGKCRD